MSADYHMDDESPRRAYDARLMRRLLGYVRPYRHCLIAAVLLLLIVSVISNISPLLIMWSVDHYINNPDRTELHVVEGAGGNGALATQVAEDMQGLLRIVALLAALMLIEVGLRYVQMIIVALVGQRTLMTMRLDIFEHLQRLSLRFLDHNPVGRLMTRATNDVEKIQETVVSGMVQVINDLLTIVVVLGFMIAINWRLALTVVAPTPIVFATSLIFRKYAQRSFLEVRRKIAHLNAYLQENISGMRVVQIFRREDANFAEYRRRNAEHRDEWLRQIRNFAIYFPVVEFLGMLATALILAYCGWMILTTGREVSGAASVGTIFAFVFLADKFYSPIRALADRYNLLLEAMASSERVFRLLDTAPEIEDRPDPKPCETLRGEVEFREVWFAYEPGQWVLKNVNMHITPGERIAIVGHTGAGKTTLINLLNRFYDVQQGAILVDGVDIRDYPQVALRRKIGMVLQDVFLFSGTIEENIRLGDDAMPMDHVRACARHVNAAAFIERLPGSYAYHVGERGCNLSTGQRQLLAFARTLAHNPRILVLDEATSSIDTETEALIQDAITKLMAGRTSIVIAHRLSTVQHADRIIVMHHGEVRESGSHQELLAHGGIYHMLYELQYRDAAG